MILLTIKAHLTVKILWNFEPNYHKKLEQVETKIISPSYDIFFG